MKLKLFVALTLIMGVSVSDLISDINIIAAAPARKTAPKSKYTRYTGTVGDYKVTMFLDNNGNGYYYYGNGSRGKLKLRGKLLERGARMCNYKLYEYNDAGQQTAVWEVSIGLMWVGEGQYIQCITGEMTTNGRVYEVWLDA